MIIRGAIVGVWAAAWAAATLGSASPGHAQERLTIDRLYSLPRIIGTAPSGLSWSADSRRLAFLWNDQGTNFRDVWVVGVDGAPPVRLTRFPRPAMVEAGNDPVARRASERALQDRGVSAVSWFPDGRHVLVTLGRHFYRVPAEAAAAQWAAHPQPGGRAASFSASGDRLAYLSRGDLWIAAVGAGGLGDARQATHVAGEGVGAARYSWSPDGRHVVITVRDARAVRERLIPDYLGDETVAAGVPRAFPGEDPGSAQLLVVDVESGAARLLRLGGDDRDLVFGIDWSPDGRRLLVDTSDLYVKNRRLLSVDVASGAARLLYREQEPENVMAFWSSAWGPGGEHAYFVSDRGGHYHLYRVAAPDPAADEAADRAAGTGAQPSRAVPEAVTRGDWAVEGFHLTDSAAFVVANRAHPAERHLYRVALGGGQPVRLSERAGTHTPTYSPDGRWAAVRFSSDAAPPDLYLNRLAEPGERRITDSPLPEFASRAWAKPEYVTFPSHVDGATIHGRLMLPEGLDPSRSYPAIIGSIYSNTLRNQWGGRTAHPLWGLDQYLLQEGYVLLNVNIRGSWGLGRDFRRRMQRDYGGIDTEDIYSGVQYLDSLGYVDMDRVGIWGSSYGGLMTAMSLFKRPGVFAAGVAGAPATNVWHATTGEMRVMGRPQEEPEAYARSSAFTWAAGLEDPLMIIHGMRDRIVLFKDSLVLLDHLIALGKADLVEFVPLPDSPHGWDLGTLDQTRFAFKKLVGHFERHLRPGQRQR